MRNTCRCQLRRISVEVVDGVGYVVQCTSGLPVSEVSAGFLAVLEEVLGWHCPARPQPSTRLCRVADKGQAHLLS